MTLTKKEAYKLHYELWDWLYYNPSKEKRDWPKWIQNGGDIEKVLDYCFLCEYFRHHWSCSKCPLRSKDDPEYNCELYYKWDEAKTPKTKKKYAKLIRDIIL